MAIQRRCSWFVWSIWFISFISFSEPDKPKKPDRPGRPDEAAPRHAPGKRFLTPFLFSQRGESATARCASTGNCQVSLLISSLYSLPRYWKGVAKAALDCAHRTSTVSSCAFCEQRGRLAAPFPLLHLLLRPPYNVFS